MKNTLLLLIITNCISLSAQHLIQSELSVIENGSILINPFTGGLNFCQLSNIDLDNDGKKDIFVFDRSGDRNLCFLNSNTDSGNNYVYSKNYVEKFPKLKNWALNLKLL